MPRVKIDTPGVTVELDANETSVTELGKQAMDMFREASEVDSKHPSGPAVGFSMERHNDGLQRGYHSGWHRPRPTSEGCRETPEEEN